MNAIDPTDEDALPAHMRRENAFLRTRIAQLQGEVWDLSGRLAQALQPPGYTVAVRPIEPTVA